MMKILIMSDSHGRLDNARQAIQKAGKIDMVIHLGDIIGQDDILRNICDCQVIIVKGNCDFYSDNELVEVISLEKNRIFATHGHRYSVDWGVDSLYFAAQERECNIAMYGHTHVPEVLRRGNMTIVNPGSISKPRQSNRKPSYIIMEISKEGEASFRISYL